MPRLSKIGAAALAAFGWTGLQSVTASYLQVAGGGGGGFIAGGNRGAGGGAGGLLTGTVSLNLTLSYTVTVGAGGTPLANGSNSTITGTGISITASVGGGAGGSQNGASSVVGQNGGSGGGGPSQSGSGSNAAGTGTVGQGNDGAAGTNAGSQPFGCGGGGGAGAVGTLSNDPAGAGGVGLTSSITGTSTYYAGGGGGGTYAAGPGVGGAGGLGGGGTGGGSGGNSTSGTANLGGGGGGAEYSQTSGSSGGSGVVIISYVGAQQFGGGVVTSSGGNTIHTFNTSGTLSPLSSLTASYLIVAGGGGGSFGGAGAGGLLSGSGLTIDTNSIYAVTVGAGGAGQDSFGTVGTNGSSSAFSMVATTAVGGGGGGAATGTLTGNSGGSGGGGGNSGAGGAGTSGQGNAGGTGYTDGLSYGIAGGGGGASAVGQTVNAGSSAGGNGGAGTASSISGSSVTYAGGGGGGGTTVGSRAGGTGGAGGGGAGTQTGSASSGTNSLGGGGGGAGSATGNGGSGGSGVVIISYPGSTQQMAGGTVTVAGGNVIHTFTSSGYLTPIVLVTNSLRFRSSVSAYLNRTFTQSGDTQKFTQSVWCKRGTLGAYQTIGYTFFTGTYNGQMRFNSNDTLDIYVYYDGSSYTGQLSTTQVFRDPSAWYHFVLAVDTTQATAANRIKFYVNGVQVTAFGTANYPNQNQALLWNASGNTGYFINAQQGSTYFFDGYITELNYIDGLALTPNSFGTSNGLGVWQPIRYGGSYGTNGFYLPFTNLSTISASYLVVAGGGGGGSDASNGTQAGGGGAGGYLTSTVTLPINGVFTVTVGGPGTGGTGSNSGSNGSDSVLSGSGISTITSTGGGRGGSRNTNSANNGGSGGGGAPSSVGTGTVGQGNDGGSGNSSGGGGGGGAGAVGGSTTAPDGGIGLQSSISGTSTYYAGGGGGRSGSSPFTQGTGGSGGGGAYGNAGTVNTGGGGGGGGGAGGKDGGSGIVIISYAGSAKFTGGTITSSGGNTIHTFTSSGTLGVGIAADYSPNGNNWTPNNISLTAGSTYDSMTDVPTLTSATTANYAVINPLKVSSNAATISSANLNVLFTLGSGQQTRRQGTIGVSTGKYYFEVLVNAVGGNYPAIGVMFSSTSDMNNYVGAEAGTFGYYSLGGVNGGGGGRTYSSYTANDVIGVAMDLTNSQLTFYKNGANAVTSGTTYESLTAGAEYVPAVSGFDNASFSINFGQRPFAYTPPTGFVALNTFNLQTPTIGATAATTANEYMDVVLYSGNNSTQNIAVGFQPDWVWSKCRNVGRSHRLSDAVRGSTRDLYSDTTDDEENNGSITSFISTGFSLDNATGSAYNTSGENYVSWAWKANGAGSANTAGTIASTVSSNTTAGFSIVTYTGNATGGATVGHGLLVGGVATAPSMIIVKVRNAVARWVVYQKDVITANNEFLELDTTAKVDTSGTNFWTIASINNTTFGLGTNADTNGSTLTFVAYCFAPVAGYSAFGTYTGNGATDGTFVYTGFRPRFVMVKCSSNTTASTVWVIFDTSRSPYNAAVLELYPDSSTSEGTDSNGMDILSNGFKPKRNSEYLNFSGWTYIYMAFAESPFKYANAR